MAVVRCTIGVKMAVEMCERKMEEKRVREREKVERNKEKERKIGENEKKRKKWVVV